ncbi:hypothetical protein, partial [Streptomyces sp. NPDC020298]|uniref:hypothetical protein n=1 Tax=Streptomyces sp. NPDC020298 TaxID=3155010 RepID=UPI00340359CA
GGGGGDPGDAVHGWLLGDNFVFGVWQPLAKKIGNEVSCLTGEPMETRSTCTPKAPQNAGRQARPASYLPRKTALELR